MSRRTSRVNELLRHELSELILRELKDPRVAHGMVSITEVQVSPDLRHAAVFVSHLGDEAERGQVLAGLSSAAHFLQGALQRRLHMKHAPALVFRFDPSIERGARLAALIHEISEELGEGGDGA